jgi:GT2 family glycosyltransferase
VQSVKVSVLIAHSKDRTSELLEGIINQLKDNPEIEILHSSEGNKSECRNMLALQAKGEILLFFDDDIQLLHSTVEELLHPFSMAEFGKVGIVGGCNIAFPDADEKEKMASRILSNSLATFRSSSRYAAKGNMRLSDETEILSCNMAVLRKAFMEAGGFPVDIIPCEENVLINRIQKLGYSIVYNPFAVVYHRQPQLFRSYAKKLFDYGKGRGIMTVRGEGALKIFRSEIKQQLMLIAGYIVHIAAYSSGLCYGIVKTCFEKEKHKKQGEGEFP